MTEQRRVAMIAAEALAVDGRFIDEAFDQLDPVVAQRMKVGRTLSATDYFIVPRQWAARCASASSTRRPTSCCSPSQPILQRWSGTKRASAPATPC